jgi:hypothetical protein
MPLYEVKFVGVTQVLHVQSESEADARRHVRHQSVLQPRAFLTGQTDVSRPQFAVDAEVESVTDVTATKFQRRQRALLGEQLQRVQGELARLG